MKENMKQRYRVFLHPWGTYYFEDLVTGKQETLKTRDKDEAFRLVAAKNEKREDSRLQPASSSRIHRNTIPKRLAEALVGFGGQNRPRKKASVNNFLVSVLPIPRRRSMVIDASMPAGTMNCVILYLHCRRGQRNSALTTAGDGKRTNQNKTERKSI